jgi:protein phosphatase
VILRSVNGAPEPGDVLPLALRAGDRVLLASDGLTDLVAPAWIEQLVRSHEDDQALTDALVNAALAQGGRDNITVVVATLVDDEEGPGSPVFLGAADVPGHVVPWLDVSDQ